MKAIGGANDYLWCIGVSRAFMPQGELFR